MKIGLVRHFKVKQAFPKKRLVDRSEVIAWFDNYEVAEIEKKEVDLCGVEWKYCYSSPLNRAMTTAKYIYKGEITEAPGLKELDILHLLPERMKLPFMVWGIWVRIKSLSSNESTRAFAAGIRDFVDELLSEKKEDVLIVSHWFVMKALQKEFIKRGLSGNSFRSPDHGILYVFERTK